MITARNLLHNAVNLLTKSPRTTLIVIAPALVLMCGVSLITAIAAPDILHLGTNATDVARLTDNIIPLSLMVGFVFSYALMAILWHRHTLRECCANEPFGPRLLAGYMWRVIALALIQLAASLAMIMPLMILSETGTGGAHPPSTLSVLLTTLFSQLVLLWLLLRLSLVLPAAALGSPMSITQSWQHTGKIARPLWGVAAALALVNTAFTSVTTLFDLTGPLHALFFELPVYVIEGLLIFSVLTTLYAYLVQKNTPGAA